MSIAMMHEAKAPVQLLRGQTEFERLMQDVQRPDVRLADLYAYYYAEECAKQLGVKLNEKARTLVEALGGGGLVGLDLDKADQLAFERVYVYFDVVGRINEYFYALGREGEAEAYELVKRLWDESADLMKG
jgi:hypothetical protein